ncbi:hypothetical protein EDD98_5600 [Streptomyces sp. PanSC19]|nr:hypothetical protein EDD98_5600 [Streptomyces sp. PanSC19]
MSDHRAADGGSQQSAPIPRPYDEPCESTPPHPGPRSRDSRRIVAAEADLHEAIPGNRFPALDELRGRGVFSPHPAPHPRCRDRDQQDRRHRLTRARPSPARNIYQHRETRSGYRIRWYHWRLTLQDALETLREQAGMRENQEST